MLLLERQTQLEELTRYLHDAGSRAGRIAFVGGEAGAGKSALVEQFAQQVSRTARVLWGHSDALQTSRVLGPVNEVAAGLSQLPGHSIDRNLSREQLFAVLFERFSPPNPLTLVVLEDLHWADEATLDFVRFIGRRVQRTRCLMIATYRDDELAPSHLLRGVLGELTGQHTPRIRVPALSLNAIEQLARGTRRDAQTVYQVTGGNPFFVRELLSAPTDTVPETVRDAVLARLLQCSPAAREVAELVSLLPGRTELWLMRALLGEVGAAADEAAERGLLRYHDGALAFRHELGRLAVESTIPRGRARELHQSILRSLIEHRTDLSQIVHHAIHASDVKVLLEYTPRAAQQAAVAGAHREAAAHLATAIGHSETLNAQERARLFELHAIECDLTNQVAASLDSATQALAIWRQLADITAQARMLLMIGMQQWKSGKKSQAHQPVAEAISLLETLPPSRELAMAYSARSQRAMTDDQTQEALDFAQRALQLAEQFGDNSVRSHALNNLGSTMMRLDPEAGISKLRESLAVALEHNLQEHAGRAYANLVSLSVDEHMPALVSRYVPEGIEYCEVHEIHDCLSYIRAYAAHFELDSGQWSKAANVAEQLIDHHAPAVAQLIPALVVLALVRARRGDPGVDPLLDEAMRLAIPTGELQRIGQVAAAAAEVAWYRGDTQSVLAHVKTGLKAATGRQARWIVGELAFWGRRADPTLAINTDAMARTDVTTRTDAAARTNPTARMGANGAVIPTDIAHPYQLMIEGNWKDAASAWQRLAMPYEQALALAEGPEESLRESLEIIERLGAGPLGAIVRQRLRERGVRGIPRGPRSSTRGNPAGLTSREIQVLALLVRGHTNTELAQRLHVSARTVDHHVSSILEKLEVRSRTEAVAAAFGLGIVKPAG
jgi:DNA-binding CsgD family transcriptional regulator/tetratricopeptide (TPR) repeat protein